MRLVLEYLQIIVFFSLQKLFQPFHDIHVCPIFPDVHEHVELVKRCVLM